MGDGEREPWNPGDPAAPAAGEARALVPDERAPDAEASGASDGNGQNEWLPTALLLFAMMALMWTLMRRQGRRGSRASGEHQDLDPSERIEAIRGQAAKRASVDRVSADMEELCQRLAAHMDNKAARLEVLLEEADARIRRLESLERGESTQGQADSGRGGETGHSQSIGDRWSSGGRAGGAERGGGFEPEQGRARGTGDAGVDPMHRRVYELADEGMGPVEIASKLNQPTGQVELILALRRR